MPHGEGKRHESIEGSHKWKVRTDMQIEKDGMCLKA